MDMNALFERALKAAHKFYPSKEGMASVKVEWHPQKSRWQAEARWGNDERIRTEGEYRFPDDALNALVNLLEMNWKRTAPK